MAMPEGKLVARTFMVAGALAALVKAELPPRNAPPSGRPPF